MRNLVTGASFAFGVLEGWLLSTITNKKSSQHYSELTFCRPMVLAWPLHSCLRDAVVAPFRVSSPFAVAAAGPQAFP